jgi:hypothetical protein
MGVVVLLLLVVVMAFQKRSIIHIIMTLPLGTCWDQGRR